MLEEVATTPFAPSMHNVREALQRPDFASEVVYKMLYQLVREGLLGKREKDELFITESGLEYLTRARFDLPLPEPGKPRPGSRKTRK